MARAEGHREGPFAAAAHPERARIRHAVMELVVERGYPALTEEDVIKRARVDRAAFRRAFADVQDCCLRIYMANIDEFDRVVFAAADSQRGWRNRLRAAAYATARYARERPIETRFDTIGMLEVGELAQAVRDRYIRRIIDLIDEGRFEPEAADSVSPQTAVGVFGSVYEFLRKEMQRGRGTQSAEQFVPQLMYLAVRPYFGHEIAVQELTMGAPAVSSRSR